MPQDFVSLIIHSMWRCQLKARITYQWQPWCKPILPQDALTLSDDVDGDGDPDVIRIKLEVVELTAATPDGNYLINTYDIAPGIQPALWVFAPKSSGMALKKL